MQSLNNAARFAHTNRAQYQAHSTPQLSRRACGDTSNAGVNDTTDPGSSDASTTAPSDGPLNKRTENLLATKDARTHSTRPRSLRLDALLASFRAMRRAARITSPSKNTSGEGGRIGPRWCTSWLHQPARGAEHSAASCTPQGHCRQGVRCGCWLKRSPTQGAS